MNSIFKVLSIVVILISLVLFFVDKKRYYKFTLLALLLFPKVNLVNVGGSTTGIRYDDFLLFAFLVLSIGEIIFELRRNHSLRVIHALVVCWVVFGLVSTFYGILQSTVSSPLVSILTSLRKYEYFVALFVGYFYFKKYDQKDFIISLRISSLILLVLCGLQLTGIFGGWISGEYVKELGYPIGVFNGAYEYACVNCIFLAIFLYDAFKRSKISYIFCLVALGQIVLSQSRSGILLAAILVMLMAFKYSKIIFVGAAIFGVVVLVALKNSTTLLDRFATIDIRKMMLVLKDRVARGDYFAALRELPTESNFPFIKTDLSFYVRTTKWGAALDGFQMNPIFGYGPGQLSVLDGSYVKILCEGGLASAFVFIAILAYLFRTFRLTKASACKWVLFVVMCFALFIDIFDSSKNMQLLWMIAGSSFASVALNPKPVSETKPQLEYAS